LRKCRRTRSGSSGLGRILGKRRDGSRIRIRTRCRAGLCRINRKSRNGRNSRRRGRPCQTFRGRLLGQQDETSAQLLGAPDPYLNRSKRLVERLRRPNPKTQAIPDTQDLYIDQAGSQPQVSVAHLSLRAEVGWIHPGIQTDRHQNLEGTAQNRRPLVPTEGQCRTGHCAPQQRCEGKTT